MVGNTSFAKLRPALESSFGVLGNPDKLIHNDGLPYNGQEWQRFGSKIGSRSDFIEVGN